MKEIFNFANSYIKKMNVADMAMIKVCLLSLGVLAGICVPKKHKKKTAAIASTAFAFTYAPFMTKLLVEILENSKNKAEKISWN